MANASAAACYILASWLSGCSRNRSALAPRDWHDLESGFRAGVFAHSSLQHTAILNCRYQAISLKTPVGGILSGQGECCDSSLKPADVGVLGVVCRPFLCEFTLAANSSRDIPNPQAKYLNMALAFNAQVTCGSTNTTSSPARSSTWSKNLGKSILSTNRACDGGFDTCEACLSPRSYESAEDLKNG